jgi:hypothetical protein
LQDESDDDEDDDFYDDSIDDLQASVGPAWTLRVLMAAVVLVVILGSFSQ